MSPEPVSQAPQTAADDAIRDMVKSEFRRRFLLGGAAAIPMVVTVATPRRGFAQATSALCFTKFVDPNTGSTDPRLDALSIIDPGTYTREELRTMVLGETDSSPPAAPLDALDALMASANCLASNGILVSNPPTI